MLTALCVLIYFISRVSLLKRIFVHTEHATHCQAFKKWFRVAYVLHVFKTVNDSTIFTCQNASALESHLQNIEKGTILLARYMFAFT